MGARRISLDELIDITGRAESRNRDFDAQGRPVRSPKGALYKMQVMPSTARDPGFGIRPARDQSPEEYNRVGREYLAAMAKKYGSMDKAWAAYNGGPGRLDRVGGVARMPKETRDYVASNMKALGAGKPQPMEDEVENDDLAVDGGTPYVPVGLRSAGGLNAAGGLGAEILGLQKEMISSQERQREMRAQQLQEATRLLQERRLGPSRSEELLQLSAAFLQPRRYKGFGATMENVIPVLAQQSANKRQGADARAEALMKLQHQYQNNDAEGETASIKARADLLKLAAQTGKPRGGFNPITGDLVDMNTGEPIEAEVPTLTPEEVAAASRDPANRGREFRTTDGRLMRIK